MGKCTFRIVKCTRMCKRKGSSNLLCESCGSKANYSTCKHFACSKGINYKLQYYYTRVFIHAIIFSQNNLNNCNVHSVKWIMHLSMLTPRGGGGGGSAICGVFDHQLHPHPGDFDQNFAPSWGNLNRMTFIKYSIYCKMVGHLTLYVNNEFECFIRGSKHEKTV